MACVAVICSPRHEGQFKPTTTPVGMASTKAKTKKAPEVKEEGTEWDCTVCTYKNVPKAFKCAICDTRKPSSTRKNSLEMPHTPTPPSAFSSPSSKPLPLTPSNKKTKKTPVEKEKKKGSSPLKRSHTQEAPKTPSAVTPSKRAKKEPVPKDAKKDSSAVKTKKAVVRKAPSTPVAKEAKKKSTEKEKKKSGEKPKTAPKRKLTQDVKSSSSTKPSPSKKAKKETKNDTDKGAIWNCPACTFENRAGAYKCAMCDTRKGSSTRRSSLMEDVPKSMTTPSKKTSPKKNTKKEKVEKTKKAPSSASPKKTAEKKKVAQGPRTSSTPRVVEPAKKKAKKELTKEKKEEKKEEKEKSDESTSAISLGKGSSTAKKDDSHREEEAEDGTSGQEETRGEHGMGLPSVHIQEQGSSVQVRHVQHEEGLVDPKEQRRGGSTEEEERPTSSIEKKETIPDSNEA